MDEWTFHRNVYSENTPHTCTSAATSKASQLNADIAEILKEDYWKNAKTFFNFYRKTTVRYAPKDVDFMSILTWNIYVICYFYFYASKTKFI